MMGAEQTACQDLKAFERRLIEVVACYQPLTRRWRIFLATIIVITVIGAWQWYTDNTISVWSPTQMIFNHPFFVIALTFLIILFLRGIHKKIVAPSIIAARTRTVLADFNMSCDDTGKLILKPRPTTS